jgi:hypothetical protein
MNIYRILMKRKEPNNSWFFLVDVFLSLNEAQNRVLEYNLDGPNNYRIIMQECVLFGSVEILNTED